MNFTQCFVADDGSGAMLSATTAALSVMFLTFENMTGSNVIDEMGNGDQLIEHSNFYHNGWGAVLTGNSRGAVVCWWIFNGNMRDIELLSNLGDELTPCS
jgi:hypothetical protein